MALFQNGIDVSRYQGNINWGRVAAAGKQFAIVRVGSGNSGGLYVDPYFLQNVNGAKAAGLRVGAYYYTVRPHPRRRCNELTTLPERHGRPAIGVPRSLWTSRTQALPAWAVPS